MAQTVILNLARHERSHSTLASQQPGQVGRNYVERHNGQIDELQATDQTQIKNGDIFVIETPGGEGSGNIKSLKFTS